MALAAVLRSAAVPPLLPDGDEARDWAEQELSDSAYRAAEPNWLDRAARAVAEWLLDLFSQQPGEGWGQAAGVVLLVLVMVIVVGAFLVWGLPRVTARQASTASALFGADAVQSAAEHRRAAAAAAARADWDTAVLERVRAIARALDERLLVQVPPGATVHAFARRAARTFPALAGELDAVADTFDDVRYLRRPGTEAAYDRVRSLDERLATEHAVRDEALV